MRAPGWLARDRYVMLATDSLHQLINKQRARWAVSDAINTSRRQMPE